MSNLELSYLEWKQTGGKQSSICVISGVNLDCGDRSIDCFLSLSPGISLERESEVSNLYSLSEDE